MIGCFYVYPWDKTVMLARVLYDKLRMKLKLSG